MKPKKTVRSRLGNTPAFDRSIANLVTLAGFPTSRPHTQPRNSESIASGITINMADLEAGISNLLRYSGRS